MRLPARRQQSPHLFSFYRSRTSEDTCTRFAGTLCARAPPANAEHIDRSPRKQITPLPLPPSSVQAVLVTQTRKNLLHSNQPSNTFKMHNMSVVEKTIMADGIEWRYINDGTAEWGLHFPEARGDCQSPINLNSRQAVYDSTLNQPTLNADYALCRECEMINTGNTVQISVKYKPDGVMAGLGKSEPPPRSVLTGGPLAPDSTYELAEFTFHWGKEDDRGSEHTVNGKAYPMELHLIHWNSRLYETVEEAMGRDDGIAIIALFIQVGREHMGLRTLTDYLETVQSKGKSISITTPFHPTCLLPDPMLRDFWTYKGSLTTPPCNEKVTWIIFRYPLTISHTQMEEFRRLKNYPKGGHPALDDDGFLADNFRPTQPLNDRVVRASFQ